MLVDNTLWSGGAIGPEFTTNAKNTESRNEFINTIKNDKRVEIAYASENLVNGFMFLRKIEST